MTTFFPFTVRATDSAGRVALSSQNVGVIYPPDHSLIVSQLRGAGANAGTVITDDVAVVSWTRSGVTTSTARFKMGSSSLLFAAGNNLTRARTDGRFNFGTGDFTMEAWVYPTSLSGLSLYSSIFSDRNAGAQFNTQFWISNTNLSFTYGVSSTLRIDVGGATTARVVLNTWQHVAVSRVAGVIRLYLNGIKINEVSEARAFRTDAATIYVGGSNGYGDAWFAGNMHLRICKGVGLYDMDSFDPPLTFDVGPF